MNYVVSGNVRIGKKTEKFERPIEAKDEAAARELAYSKFGSEHGTKRRLVDIQKVEKAKA